jgi:hypothetical protein
LDKDWTFIIIQQRQLIVLHLHLSKQEQKLYNIHNSPQAYYVKYNMIGKEKKEHLCRNSSFSSSFTCPICICFMCSLIVYIFSFFLLFQISILDLLSFVRWRVNGICSLINHQRPTAELRWWWWWQGHKDISANSHHFKLRNNIHAHSYIHNISIVKVNERVVWIYINE